MDGGEEERVEGSGAPGGEGDAAAVAVVGVVVVVVSRRGGGSDGTMLEVRDVGYSSSGERRVERPPPPRSVRSDRLVLIRRNIPLVDHGNIRHRDGGPPPLPTSFPRPRRPERGGDRRSKEAKLAPPSRRGHRSQTIAHSIGRPRSLPTRHRKVVGRRPTLTEGIEVGNGGSGPTPRFDGSSEVVRTGETTVESTGAEWRSGIEPFADPSWVGIGGRDGNDIEGRDRGAGET